MKQFLIDDRLVDLSRNQISCGQQQQSLPPKVMAVLSLLAEHQGEVVSFDTLLETVWQGRVVSTNTLQRCIFQIRQCFNDDSKRQRVIKTHAKQGYSLELPVNRYPPDASTSTPKKPLAPRQHSRRFVTTDDVGGTRLVCTAPCNAIP